MKKLLELPVNKNAETALADKKYSLKTVLMMLFSRVALFLIFQCCFCLLFVLLGEKEPWAQSTKYWAFVVCLANIVCVLLLDRLLKREGARFWDFFKFSKGTRIKDFFTMSGLLLLVMPFAYFPNMFLGTAMFGGDYMSAVKMLYQPLPMWAAIAAVVLFPLTMPLGELTTYFGYVMPRLELTTKSRALAIALPALLLSLQHAALPLILDYRFIIWRAFMFLPFAFIMVLIVRWRPRLLPYILVGHALIDIMTAVTYLMPM